MEIRIELPPNGGTDESSSFTVQRHLTIPVATSTTENTKFTSSSLPGSRTKRRSEDLKNSLSSHNCGTGSDVKSGTSSPVKSVSSSLAKSEEIPSPAKTVVSIVELPPKQKSPQTKSAKRRKHLKKIYTNDEEYEERKQRLLKNSKLKKDLERYFDIETPSRLAERNKPLSDDDEYDTDLDTNLVGLELIVDEKTRQMKDDGLFPEYKQHCRDMDVIPNSYFIRHSVDDDFTMRYRYLNSGDCACMGIEMKNSLTFKKLDLEDNGIGAKQIKAMAKMLMKNNTVTDMNLRNNPLGPSGAQTIKSIFLNNAHVTKADFTGCKFGETAGESLADVIESNVYLKELYLGHNKLRDTSIRLIGRAIEKNVTLEVLDISWNGIGKIGASGIADGLRVNNQLKILNMSVNGLGPDGCVLIINALRYNDCLEEIDLSWNRITDDASDVLARFTSNSRSVKRLKLSYNLFTIGVAYKILKSMKSKLKKTLRHIELDGIDADSELLELAEQLRTKYNLTVSLNQPPSRREQSTDPLTKSLNSLVIFLEKETLTLKMLYPSLEYDKDEFISTDDVVERIKELDVISRFSLYDIKRILRPTRHRCFQLKELALVEQLRKDGHNPLLQEPLRTPLAGKRRGRVNLTPKVNKPATESGKGVRFTAADDDDDD